jgi:hypothetical protein
LVFSIAIARKQGRLILDPIEIGGVQQPERRTGRTFAQS